MSGTIPLLLLLAAVLVPMADLRAALHCSPLQPLHLPARLLAAVGALSVLTECQP